MSAGARWSVPITFDEVAVYFLEEEWRHLEAWQRELYQEVMRDNLEAVLSLGYEYRQPPPPPRVFTEDDKWIVRYSQDPLGRRREGATQRGSEDIQELFSWFFRTSNKWSHPAGQPETSIC